MEKEYSHNFEEGGNNRRLVITSPGMIPEGIWFNADRSGKELLDLLCTNHASFRTDAVQPADRQDMYPIYILKKYLPLSNVVLKAIGQLPRHDGRTNEFIDEVIRRTKGYKDYFSDSVCIVGKLVSPDIPLSQLLPSTSLSGNEDKATAIVIGVPVGEIVQRISSNGLDIMQSFVRERFQWSTARTPWDQYFFKHNVIAYYGSAHDWSNLLLYDSSTGRFVERDLVVAGHLWKSGWRSHWDTFWKDFSNNPKNGILWNRAIESAFDNGRITVYEENEQLKWHIWDPALRKIRLSADLMGTPENKTKARVAFGDMLFGDLEGKDLKFLNDNRPFRLCLYLHAKVTKLVAMEKGWEGASEYNLQSYYSDDIKFDLDLDHFLSDVSASYSNRTSFEVFPEPTSNDNLFARARALISKR